MHRFFGRLVVTLLTLALVLGAVASVSAEPTGEELYAAVLKAQSLFGVMDQFELTVQAQHNGADVGQMVLGWSGGTTFSLALNSPLLGELGSVEAGIRPSGFALLRMGPSEIVYADLVPYAELLAAIPRIFNRNTMDFLMNPQADSVTLVGETEVLGRKAYILEVTSNYETSLESYKPLFLTAYNDPAVQKILQESGISPQDPEVLWSEFVSEQTANQPLDLEIPPLRMTVDATDYLLLDMDLSSFLTAYKAAISEVLAAEIPVAVDLDRLVPEPSVTVSDLQVGEDGHITSLAWELGVEGDGHLLQAVLDLVKAGEGAEPEDIAELEAIVEAIGEKAFVGFHTSYEVSAMGDLYVPTRLSMHLNLDLSDFLTALEGSVELSEIPGGPVQEQEINLQLAWDFSKGADPTLVENVRLITAENSWAEALAALDRGDQQAAAIYLTQVVRLAPLFADAHMRLADVYYELGEYLASVSELEQVVMLDPLNATALNNLAYQYVDQSIDLGRGLMLAEAAYRLAGDEVHVVDTLGWAYYRNGMLAEAEATMAEAVELAEMNEMDHETTAFVYYRLGLVLAEREKYEEALINLETAVELDPQLTEATQLLQEVKAAYTKLAS